MCRVSFLTTLDIYKAYFKGHHKWRTHAESDLVPYSLCNKILCLCILGFCKYFLIFIVDEVKNFVVNNIFFKLLELVMYWDSCKGVSHVLRFVHH